MECWINNGLAAPTRGRCYVWDQTLRSSCVTFVCARVWKRRYEQARDSSFTDPVALSHGGVHPELALNGAKALLPRAEFN